MDLTNVWRDGKKERSLEGSVHPNYKEERRNEKASAFGSPCFQVFLSEICAFTLTNVCLLQRSKFHFKKFNSGVSD